MLKELENLGRFLEEQEGAPIDVPASVDDLPPSDRKVEESPAEIADRPNRPLVPIFCYEDPLTQVGKHVAKVACALAKRGALVHLFTRRDFELEASGVATHPLGDCDGADLLAGVQEFASRACNAFMKIFHGDFAGITLLGYEWSAIPAMSLLRGIKSLPFLWAMHSLERQRSDMTSALSQQIEAIEMSGLREAKKLLVRDLQTVEVMRALVADCAPRIATAGAEFTMDDFTGIPDPGAVKARYQIGPLDPMIVFVGDLDERYGPDMLIKALPPVLKNHPNTRVVIVGEGSLLWPLRVYTRYLLLEHAVRLVGHMDGGAVRDLIQAADMVVVPSRAETPWWPIQAAWTARRPVVATHSAAPGLLAHENDGVLVYPTENSLVWGIERVLYDADLRQSLGEAGHAKMDKRYGWDCIAACVEESAAFLVE